MASSQVDPAAQGKRKRAALGEVPKPENKAKLNLAPGTTDLKGKERVKEIKEKFEGVVLKQTVTTTTTRKPLRPVESTTTTATTVAATRRTRSTTAGTSHPTHTKPLEVLREHDEDAMAVDPQPPAPIPSPQRFVAARDASRTAAPAASRVPRRISARSAKHEEDEEEENRAHKKRRTSSDIPDVAAMHEEEVENAVIPKSGFEAEPEEEQWDDLDAEDADDPLMVSEYVVEIFEYLKQVEVRFVFPHICAFLTSV